LKLLGVQCSIAYIRVSKLEERNNAFCVLLRNWGKTCWPPPVQKGCYWSLDELDVEYASTAFKGIACTDGKCRRKDLLQRMKQITNQKANLMVAFASAPEPRMTPEDDSVKDILSVFGQAILHVKVPLPDEDNLVQHLDGSVPFTPRLILARTTRWRATISSLS